MITDKETKKISKFMSFVLRHQPDAIGLVLDENGWANVDELIEKMNDKGALLTFDILEHVVTTNAKQRFAFNEDKSLIRANQGHSIAIDLALSATQPPAELYHGTGEGSVASILATGLEKKKRQHVHLSSDIATAIAVGGRHGKPRVLVVDAGQMYTDGYSFYISENAVWLTDSVPVKYLKLL